MDSFYLAVDSAFLYGRGCLVSAFVFIFMFWLNSISDGKIGMDNDKEHTYLAIFVSLLSWIGVVGAGIYFVKWASTNIIHRLNHRRQNNKRR